MTINGIGGKVHYWISRPNNNSKGALVFTHGLTANHTMYEKQVEYFKNDYVVITWDVPLHGRSRLRHQSCTGRTDPSGSEQAPSP